MPGGQGVVIAETGFKQPSPHFPVDRPQSVKVYGRIEGHSNQLLSLLDIIILAIAVVVMVRVL
jgi:hypothetical protein